MIKKKKKKRGIVIDLDGPDGNVFQLLAYAKQLSITLKFDYRMISDEMQESTYANAVKVFDSYFGNFVTLEMSEEYAESQGIEL